jgi:hypothetical protein
MASSSTRPITPPTLARGTVIALSIITCEAARLGWSRAAGAASSLKKALFCL